MALTYILWLIIEVVVIAGLIYKLPNNKMLRKHIGDRALDITVAIILAYGIYIIGATLLFIISKIV